VSEEQRQERLVETLRAVARDSLGFDEDERIIARLAEERQKAGLPDFDSFGYHPESLRYIAPIARFLYRNYFRVEVHGLERVPEGRLLLVANHSGQIPLDGMMINTSLIYDHDPPRLVRSMVEKWVPELPFVSYLFARWGQVVGIPENCRVLLENGEAILVFPEGVRGISKTYDKRYQLQEFGLGFMRLALETKTPVLPVAVIGAEEQAPALYNFRSLARLLGAPSFPITPTFPWIPIIGLLPYPVKYHIYFGEPMSFSGDPHDEDQVVEAKVKRVKNTLQEMLNEGLARRTSIFF
jgi:1-acyl-sn-glycerol-3-phosphate acyltransferase